MVKKDRTHLYVTLFVTSILVLVGVYTIISVSTTFTDIPKEIETNVPIMQPTPRRVKSKEGAIYNKTTYSKWWN